jgi:hypothetical protein
MAENSSTSTDFPSRKLTRRGLLKAGVRSGIALSGTGMGALAWGTKVEPERLQVERIPLALPRLDKVFDGYRIAHISDFHCDSRAASDQLQRAVQQINRLQPDLVVFTGDYSSDNPSRFARDAPEILPLLNARDGVYAVMGNHDHWGNIKISRAALQKSGVRELRNEVHVIRRAQSTLNLAGIDDWWMGKANFEQVVGQLPSSGATILLAHEPDVADLTAATGRFDVQLSGHSHGGQVRMPGWGPLRLPPHGEKYHTGLYRVGKMWQYTNRGLGVVGPQVRFCCPPEITLLSLHSQRRE